MFYSKNTGGFYDSKIHGKNIPADAIEVPDQLYAELFAGQSDGRQITSDADGYPILVDRPAQTADQIWEKIKTERDQRKDGGFKVEVEPGIYKWFHSDVFSRTQHIGLENKARVLLASGGALSDIIQIPISGQLVDARWKTMDGTKVLITAQIALDIIAAAEAMDASLFYAGEQHEAAMKASADPATYDYSTGWPERFGDDLS